MKSWLEDFVTKCSADFIFNLKKLSFFPLWPLAVDRTQLSSSSSSFFFFLWRLAPIALFFLYWHHKLWRPCWCVSHLPEGLHIIIMRSCSNSGSCMLMGGKVLKKKKKKMIGLTWLYSEGTASASQKSLARKGLTHADPHVWQHGQYVVNTLTSQAVSGQAVSRRRLNMHWFML